MADVQRTPFVKDLASSDRKVRDKALDSLTLFLRSRTDLSLIDLLKLWKGLFFCFYHSDRPLTQQALARSLSYSLIPTLPRSTVHRFLRAFWITIGREFHAIDRLRLDKYMYLIRCYVGVAFEVFVKGKQKQPGQGMDDGGKKRKREEEEAAKSKNSKKQNKRSKGKKSQEAEEEQQSNGVSDGTTNDTQTSTTTTDSDAAKWTDLKSYLSIISEGPLNPLNFDPDQDTSINEKTDYVPMPHGPDGLRYHLLDLWLDELEKVLEFEQEDSKEGEEEKPRKVVSEVPMDLILGPIETLRVKGLHKPVRTRAGEALEDERLYEWGFKERKVVVDEDEESEEEWGGFD
ncbi:ribosomal RNA processing 1 family protein [Aspergillus ruber CBS 135680]|uniref:Putative ribosomal RNA processing protein n=1 Tax=Aspergillus ruber (strain CBS 135680) TaxID=1388766 RepID=A0A017SEB3_ASPRC|nr:putative ribosomal RNA processing protein [Aspergillus ruber CBS 135680]EYE95307.1 putative ribosomal RNA processing protein [Aspergillus ruber CBS 135680]